MFDRIFGLIIIEWVIIWFISALIWAIVCAWLAGQRGRDKITWGTVGFLIGFIGLILLIVSPAKQTKV